MKPGKLNLRRGVYVVPTTLTILNVFFGFRSILFSMRAIEAIAAPAVRPQQQPKTGPGKIDKLKLRGLR